MKWKPLLLTLFIGYTTNLAAQEVSLAEVPTSSIKGKTECFRSIFVESPVADTYVACEYDSLSFGKEPVMKVRGTPDRKSMVALLSFDINHLDPNYLQQASLKIYTASKNRGNSITLSALPLRVDENGASWSSHPSANEMLGNQPVTDAPYITFDVTSYLREHLKSGSINFSLHTDSKKPIDISSRESGLSSELIIEMCLSPQSVTKTGKEDLYKTNESRLKVLPCSLEGKFTLQVVGVPESGFGDLMLMTDQGDILQQIPMAMQNADVVYYTIDYGALTPGIYWAILRKGRVLIKDRFRLKPENGTTFLQVDAGLLPPANHNEK